MGHYNIKTPYNFLAQLLTNSAQIESHLQQDGKLRMQDLLWRQRLQWKMRMHLLGLQVNNSNRVSAPNDLQVARRRLRICKVEMRERGHSGKLCSIVKFSHGELIIGDRSIKSPSKSSGVSSVSRFP